VHVFVSDVSDLRGYQVAVEAKGGKRATLFLKEITLQTVRPEFVFADQRVYQARDVLKGRAVACLLNNSVQGTGLRYLATFMFRASADASGPFEFVLREDGTLLRSASDQSIPRLLGGTVSVVVQAGKRGKNGDQR